MKNEKSNCINFCIALVILLIVIVALVVDNCFLKHTPESILKANFSISLKNFDYSVETFEEQWSANGDGQALAIYKFNELTRENINYLKGFALHPLPISEKERELMIFNEIPKEYFEVDTGYYIYEQLSTHDIRDYKVFIIDTEKKNAVLYYQYM